MGMSQHLVLCAMLRRLTQYSRGISQGLWRRPSIIRTTLHLQAVRQCQAAISTSASTVYAVRLELRKRSSVLLDNPVLASYFELMLLAGRKQELLGQLRTAMVSPERLQVRRANLDPLLQTKGKQPKLVGTPAI